MKRPTLGVIGGSGLYDMPGLEDRREHEVSDIITPFGKPSDIVVEGTLEGTRVLFLPRHGRWHQLTTSEVPYRANIFALKMLGAEWLVRVSAVGSLYRRYEPGSLALVSQYLHHLDLSWRPHTFFGGGVVGHVQFADPACPELAQEVSAAAGLETTVHSGLTLMVMEGPAFSCRAEAERNRREGAHLIGMTSLPEAWLAREAELHDVALALVTDYDCGIEGEGEVSTVKVDEMVRQNAERAQGVIRRLAHRLANKSEPACACHTALNGAILTPLPRIPTAKAEAMRPIFGRAFGIGMK